MSENTLKAEIEKGISRMQTLRDEVRVRLHLAGMDAKEEWDKLEPSLVDIERKAEDFTDATRRAVEDALKRLSALRSKLS
ncbi:hypothetical protein LZC95_32000 [Pendulispora brunnea]|uniref:Tubulin-specific chaperone A n=1 Tax=Pendulispora brunnea TaxID=2905690 RepID=A0ABZ2JX54_9BACT